MRYAKTFGFIYAAVAAAIFAFASPARADAAETVKVIYIVQADDHSAGDEHEAGEESSFDDRSRKIAKAS